MTMGIGIGIFLGVVALIALVATVGPYSRSIYRRTRLHGPISGVGPGGSGQAWGWAMSALWSVGEKKREEHYEYMRTVPAEDGGGEVAIWAGPLAAADPALPQGDLQLPRDEQALIEGRRMWWSGRDWVSVRDYVPPSAERSVEGDQWWDGEQWQWVPHAFAPESTWMPHSAIEPRVKPEPSGETWVVEQRGHLRERWTTPSVPSPDRSDPPPTWLRTN